MPESTDAVELLQQIMDDNGLVEILADTALGPSGFPKVVDLSLNPYLPYDLRLAATFRATVSLQGECMQLWLAYGLDTKYWRRIACISPMVTDKTAATDFRLLSEETALLAMHPYPDSETPGWIAWSNVPAVPPGWARFLSAGQSDRSHEMSGALALEILTSGLAAMTQQLGEVAATAFLPSLNQGLESIFRPSEAEIDRRFG